MPSIATAYVTLLPETSRIASGIKAAFAQVDGRETGRRLGREIQEGIGDVTVDVDADTSSAKAQIDSIGDKKVTVKVDVDRSGLDRFLGGGGGGGGGGGFGGRGGGFFNSPLKLNLGLVGVGLLPAAATALADVAGAAQQLAGAGLVIPGIFAGITASIGTASLGMQGMKDAFDAVTKAADGTQASVDAANKALAELSPNAAETVKTAVGLKGTFTELRDIASENMFDGVSEGLKGLVGNLLPAATRGIDGISRGLNQNLLQAMDSLGSGSSQGFLDRILGNTGEAQARLTAAIDPMVHAMGVLTAAGSDALPRLADAVGKVADRFNTFITSADGDGRLTRWISEGLDGFTNLGNILLNLGKSFTAITEAAGGGKGLLQMLESASEKLQLFLNSTAGQAQMRQFFADGAGLLGQLRDIAVQLGPILSGVFNAARDAAGLWLPVIREALDVINSIPGGAQAVVTAFVAWKTISGVASLASSLNGIATLLQVTLPASAVTSAAGISGAFAALGAIAIPVTITVAAVMAGDAMTQWLFEHDPLRNFRPGGLNTPPFLPNTPTTPSGQPVPGLIPGSPIPRPQLTDAQRQSLEYQGINPATAKVEDVYKALGLPVPTPPPPPPGWGLPAAPPPPGIGNRVVPPTPPVSSYVSPVVTQSAASASSAPTPNLPYQGTANPYGGGSGYTSDAALLANVPAGRYDPSGDLSKGLGDCSSAVEDLVNIMQGNTTAGRSMATGNAAEWLTAHGFQPGTGGPGDFRVGFNSSHMQATLPGGTPFNWGSNAAAARGGVGGTGADDPAFTSHYYKPVSGSPLSSAYPSADSMGLTSSDLTLRNAQQRVNDTQHTEEQAEARLNELNAKGTATARQRADAEYDLAKAKREHKDAIDNLAVATEKYNKSQADGKSGSGDSGGNQLGQDILGGMAEVFGLDGSIFKDPTQFGIFKIFKAAMGLKLADGAVQGGDGASLFSGDGGGGGGGLSSILSMVPQAFGDLKVGSPQDAPGQFMPSNPGSDGTGGIVLNPFAPPGAAGPGNQPVVNNNHPVSFENNTFGYSQTQVQDQIQQGGIQSIRQPVRSLPG